MINCFKTTRLIEHSTTYPCGLICPLYISKIIGNQKTLEILLNYYFSIFLHILGTTGDQLPLRAKAQRFTFILALPIMTFADRWELTNTRAILWDYQSPQALLFVSISNTFLVNLLPAGSRLFFILHISTKNVTHNCDVVCM